MQESSFAEWLSTRYDDRTCSSRLSNCRRIEETEGDLDDHFRRDGLTALLGRLEYSTDDAKRGSPPRHAIPIAGDVRTGTATLRSAVKLYLRFRSGEAAVADSRSTMVQQRQAGGKWPEWPTPSAGELLQMARSVTPYARFLHPDIVQSLVEDTEKHRDEWTSALRSRGIDATLYLWPRTSCAFPGVRRHAGSSEISQFRRRAAPEAVKDALVVDDNSFPKHIWSFVLRGRPFQRFGPAGYALAHLSDHKAYKNRSNSEIVGHYPERTLYGLYTCATNAAFVPTSLMRPTDVVPELRNLLQRRAGALYGGFCNLLPPGCSFSASASAEWDLDRFDWAETVGDLAVIRHFLDFRRHEMNRLLSAP